MRKTILIFASLVLFVAVSFSQGFMGQRWRERVLEFKKVRLLEILKLDEQTSVKFLNKYTKFSNEIDEIEIERDRIVNDLEAKLRKGDKEGYDKGIKDLIELEKKEYELRMNFYNELKEILTEQQVAQVVVFERNFRREFMNAIREMQRERMRRRF
jgi:Spy/CpxP family protein refolding chaperone